MRFLMSEEKWEEEQEKYEHYFDKGYEFLYHKQYRKALSCFEEVLFIRPFDDEAKLYK